MSPPSRITFQLIRPPDRRTVFEAELLASTHSSIVLAHRIHSDKSLEHRGATVIANGYRAVWFLYKNRPYDIGRFYRPDGRWTGYYIDVLEPVRWNGADASTLEPLVDLFLDVWIDADDSFAVLDEDEFHEAVAAGHLGLEQATAAQNALADILEGVKYKKFPPHEVTRFTG